MSGAAAENENGIGTGIGTGNGTEELSFRNPYLEGNEQIVEAIARFGEEGSKETLVGVLEAVRRRMHADGHFLFPVLVNEEDDSQFDFRRIQTGDGKVWLAAFTSQEELEKGEPSRVYSFFIDRVLQFSLDLELDGVMIDPWGQAFSLTKDVIKQIFEADGDVEYHVPDDPITAELLEDGSFLKRAVGICSRNRTQLNLIKLMRILRDSWVWVPCSAILSDRDQEVVEKAVREAEEGDGLESLAGREFTTMDEVRLVPDILQNGGEFFFPVFTSAEEMGEYGDHFSKIAKHFLDAANVARNNEKNVKGIVINAFSEPFVVPVEMFDLIAEMDSSL